MTTSALISPGPAAPGPAAPPAEASRLRVARRPLPPAGVLLSLAVLVVVGLVAHVTGAPTVGAALVLAGAGSMAAAALVLLVTSPDKRRAAIIQGTLPVLGILALVIGLVA